MNELMDQDSMSWDDLSLIEAYALGEKSMKTTGRNSGVLRGRIRLQLVRLVVRLVVRLEVQLVIRLEEKVGIRPQVLLQSERLRLHRRRQ